MRAHTRLAFAAGATTLLCLGAAAAAQALWGMNDRVDIPPISLGGVAFAAQPATDDTARTYSPDGGAVEITLPGTEIAKVLGQTGIDPDPVIWRFQARGYAQGITGMTFDVAATAQVDADGTETDLSSGVAREGTLLSFSTVKVYPAAVNGDCSAVPETPEGQEGRNVVLFDNDDRVLQQPGADTGAEVVQDWCVAMDYNTAPDAEYHNSVYVAAVSADGSQVTALDGWTAAVGFPPSLDALGTYLNEVLATGTAADGSTARDTAVWEGVLYPDPSNEPDVILSLDPSVTSLRPDVVPGDHFQLAPAEGASR